MTKNTDISTELSAADMSLEDAINRFGKIRKTELSPTSSPDAISEGYGETSLFQNSPVRKMFHNNEWFYSIINIISIITGTNRPSQYWQDLKHKLLNTEGFIQLYDKIVKLNLVGADGMARPS